MKPAQINLSDFEKDALKEIANIGAGSSSSSLSEVLGKAVHLRLSDIEMVSLGERPNENFLKLFDGDDQIIGVVNSISTDFIGNVLVLFKKSSALSLSNLLLKIKDDPKREMTDHDKLKLKEIGKIVSSSYLKSFNDFFGTTLSSCTDSDIFFLSGNPEKSNDLKFTPDYNAAVLFKTRFNIDRPEIYGEFMLLLTMSSIESILALIKNKLGVIE